MKKLLSLLFILAVLQVGAQSPGKFDFSIVFDGNFQQDTVSMKINHKPIFTKYILDTQNPSLKGNLSVLQQENFVKINLNGKEKRKKAVEYNFILNINVIINKQEHFYAIDLRKGNIVILQSPFEAKTAKTLTIQQIQEPFLLDVVSASTY